MERVGYLSITAVFFLLLVVSILSVLGGMIYMTANQSDRFLQFPDSGVKKIVNDIASHFVVEEGYAQFNETGLKLLLLIDPVFNTNISASKMVLQVGEETSFRILKLQEIYEANDDLFGETFWEQIGSNYYAIIPVVDPDKSISDKGLINGDVFFIAFFAEDVKRGDTISCSLLTPYGVASSIEIDVPFSTSAIFRIY